MRHLPRRLTLATMTLLVAVLPAAWAQTPAVSALYDPAQLPAFHGTVQLFTLTPPGDINGFVFTDGTEVKTPPHLGTEIARAVRPGDRVTVHGLRAATLPLIDAMSVSNDATGATVLDVGPQPGRMPPLPGPAGSAVSVEGRLRMLLHGPRGDVNGALLEDGTVLDLPPSEAARFAAVLVPGRTVTAEGVKRVLPFGSVVDLTALASQGDAPRPVAGHAGPPATPGVAPPG